MDDKRYDALQKALDDLSAGEESRTVFAANPGLEAEIETAQQVGALSPAHIPPAVIQRSRTRVLARAMQLRQETRPRGGIFPRIPRVIYAVILAIVFLISWNGLIYASAQALPGDQLYPAKLTLEKLRLGLAINPQTHQQVEEEYQARRTDEVTRLLALGRVEFVQFFGIVEEQWDDRWIVEGIEVRLLPETIILGNILPKMTIEVEGATQPDGWVQASEIHLQNFSFIGTVESISDEVWTISGRDVLITSSSQIDSDTQIGDTVNVEVTSDDFGTLTARSITLFGPKENDLFITETPERLERIPIDTLVPSEPDDSDEPGEADDMDEADEVDNLDEDDEADETDRKKDSDQSDEADERDDSDESDQSDEQDNRDESDDADESDEIDKSDKSDD